MDSMQVSHTCSMHTRAPYHVSTASHPSSSGRWTSLHALSIPPGRAFVHPPLARSSPSTCAAVVGDASTGVLAHTQHLQTRRRGARLTRVRAAPVEQPSVVPDSSATHYLDKLLADKNVEGDLSSLLRVTESFWRAQKAGKSPKPPTVVTEYPTQQLGSSPEYDVVVAGGTLGLFVALSLQLRGARVCIVERRRIEGRTQEWNSSRAELQVLVTLGLLTQEQLNSVIVTEFNPVRVGFKGMDDIWVRDCLNVGVDPVGLVAAIKARFREAGGVIKEHTELKKVAVFPDGVRLTVAAGGNAPMDVTDVNRPTAVRPTSPATPRESTCVSGRLLLDCMGHYSSIVKQIRGAQQPDGMLVVMGGCFDGVPPELNSTADLLYTFEDVDPTSGLQWFWEAFPADGGRARTAYMFAYTDADPSRPAFREMLTTFFSRLPAYQGVALEDVRFRRVLMGGFPCWQQSPLQPAFDRVLQVADASAAHSPLSFGGFGSLLRHLPRLTAGITDALQCDRLDRESLTWLQPYQPSLSCSWLYQRSMGLAPGHLQGAANAGRVQLPPDHVNRLLVCNFAVMRVLGDGFMRPFLQDTLRLVPLASTMTLMMFRDPVAILRVLPQVGPAVFFSWFRHFAALVAYTLLYNASGPVRGVLESSYEGRRMLDAWKWGSSSDYVYHPPSEDGGDGGDGEHAALQEAEQALVSVVALQQREVAEAPRC